MTNYRKRPTDLARLATHAAKDRGHDLGFWHWAAPGDPWGDRRPAGGRIYGRARCLDCRAEAYIDNKPEPNGIDISGEAVAVACKGSAK